MPVMMIKKILRSHLPKNETLTEETVKATLRTTRLSWR